MVSPAGELPHIIVVDDDAEIRSLLSDYLQKSGYRTTGVTDGTQLERLLQRTRADLIVLDLMLPGEDGFTVCRKLRAHSQVPVIMLTARDEDIDQIIGFEVGADDYVRKPFDPRALVARIKAVLRRADHLHGSLVAQANGYRFAGWHVDVIGRRLTGPDGRQIVLNGAEYSLLIQLLSDPKRVWSRNDLAQALQGREADPFDRSIDVRVSRLRQKLGDSARAPALIKTVYGGGYVMGVPVESE